jgi:hypothetical protein
MHLLAGRTARPFGGDYRDVLKEGVTTYLTAAIYIASYYRSPIFCLVLRSVVHC